jgi:hypothetical protein
MVGGRSTDATFNGYPPQAQKAMLGIRSYGLSMTTLEEVFLRIAADDTPEATAVTNPALLNLPTSRVEGPDPSVTSTDPTPRLFSSAPSVTFRPAFPPPLSPAHPPDSLQSALFTDPHQCVRHTGLHLWWMQLCACTIKHVCTLLREPLSLLTRLIIPLLLVLSGVLMSKHRMALPAEPTLLLTAATAVPGWIAVTASSEVRPPQPVFLQRLLTGSICRLFRIDCNSILPC